MPSVPERMLETAIADARLHIGIEQAHDVHTKEGNIRRINYKIKRIIGRGTFGIVSQIEVEGRVGALKTVYQDNKYCNREIDILLDIEHRNVIRLNEYFYTRWSLRGHFLNMCMEYMPIIMEDLVQDKTIALDRVRHLYRQALSGLAYLHALQICHRDIKPANILLNESWELKICDFGSAKYLDGAGNIPYICSRYYRAPENLAGCRYYGTKIDIWAMGLVFCEFRVEGPLFQGRDNNEMLDAVLGTVEARAGALERYGYRLEKAYHPPGIRAVLRAHFADERLLDVFDASLAIDFNERASAEEILKMPFFR